MGTLALERAAGYVLGYVVLNDLKLAQLNVDALPLCGEEGKLRGMITEHDIVTRGLALGEYPNQTRAAEVGYGKPLTIGADHSLLSAIETMAAHNVRRLFVIDGERLVGVLSIADVSPSSPTPKRSPRVKGRHPLVSEPRGTTAPRVQ
jgi:CBS domain-containing protein